MDREDDLAVPPLVTAEPAMTLEMDIIDEPVREDLLQQEFIQYEPMHRGYWKESSARRAGPRRASASY